METWDVIDLLDDDECVFIVRNLRSKKLLYTIAIVQQYINQYGIEDNKIYDVLFYAERIFESDLNDYVIFTDLPFSRFSEQEPNFEHDRISYNIPQIQKKGNMKRPKKTR